jgi:Formate hydrogenlyase subunit 6/NADH:ubiquinone oxidoreductase 23 kD subunit (chain I)
MLMVKTIMKNLFGRYATRLHPFEQKVLPEAYRGRFKFAIDKCIMCNACALKCPTLCISINPDTGYWAREVKGCVYCGVCADKCPTGCITMTNVYKPPITELTIQEFHCKPRVKKGKASASEVQDAILEKQKEDEKKPQVMRKVVAEK